MKTKEHIQYHKDGSVWATGQMCGDQMHGYWEWFRKDGVIMRSGFFDNGRQVGAWTTYDKHGKVYKVTTMKAVPPAGSVAPQATDKKARRTCTNGHQYYKSSDCPVCPVCEEAGKTGEGFLSFLSAPARRALEHAGISTLKQLAAYSEHDILKLHGIGKTTIPILKGALAAAGLTFHN